MLWGTGLSQSRLSRGYPEGNGRILKPSGSGGGLGEVSGIDVEAVEIARRGDDGQIVLGHLRGVRALFLEPPGGVGPPDDGIEQVGIPADIGHGGGLGAGGVLDQGHGDERVVHQADLGVLAGELPHQAHRPAMGQEGMVIGLVELAPAHVQAGSMLPVFIGLADEAGDFVHGHPMPHPVSQAADDGLGIDGEGIGGAAGHPAALVLQGLGQIPVVQGDVGLDAGLEQGVGEPIVEVQTGLVDGAPARGDNPGPGGAEAVGLGPQLLHETDILGIAVVMITGDIAIMASGHLPRRAAEAIPDAFAAAVFPGRAFHLEGGGGGAPDEIGWEMR